MLTSGWARPAGTDPVVDKAKSEASALPASLVVESAYCKGSFTFSSSGEPAVRSYGCAKPHLEQQDRSDQTNRRNNSKHNNGPAQIVSCARQNIRPIEPPHA
jgi:hypothetical protein